MRSMALSICWAAVFSPVLKAMGGVGWGGAKHARVRVPASESPGVKLSYLREREQRCR